MQMSVEEFYDEKNRPFHTSCTKNFELGVGNCQRSTVDKLKKAARCLLPSRLVQTWCLACPSASGKTRCGFVCASG